jgi:hypothetical protein
MNFLSTHFHFLDRFLSRHRCPGAEFYRSLLATMEYCGAMTVAANPSDHSPWSHIRNAKRRYPSQSRHRRLVVSPATTLRPLTL